MRKTVVTILCFLYTYTSALLLPNQLTVEYLTQPLGVDSPNPRLGWILNAQETDNGEIPKNQSQTAYQIIAASSKELLSSRKPDLWDSEKVQSDRTFHVRYQGKALLPGQTVFWTVRVWDQDNQVSAYAKASTWDNGFDETHWSGKWIGAPPGLHKKALVNLRPEDEEVLKSHDGLKPVIHLRKHQIIDPRNIKQAKLYSTARGMYRVYFNSVVPSFTGIVQPKFSPGWTDYNKTIQYQSHDIIDYIDDGNITIGAILTTGWYSGYVGYERKHSYYGNQEFLLIELQIEYENGTILVITSDESWKASTGALVYADLLQGELFYEDKQLINWMEPTYNDSDWVSVITEPLSKTVKFVSEASSLTSMTDIIKVTESWQISEDVWVYDFGVNFAGYPMITLYNFPYNVTLQVKHGEMLHPNGSVYTENLRNARAIDTYVCNDVFYREVYLVLQPHFTYHGFRYIEISGLSVDNSDDIVGIRVAPLNMIKSTFTSDNSMVNKLHKNIVRGQLSNFISVPTDCPQRDERLGWMADAQIFAPTAIYNGDVAAFYTKWMRDVREGQAPNGAFSNVAPRLVDLSDAAPAWGDAGVLLTWHMYHMNGDVQLIEDNYQAMERWLNYILSSNPTFIWKNNLNHNFGDWLSVNESTPREIVSTSYFANDALLMSLMAKAINKTADAQKYAHLHANIAKAFNNEFVNSTTGKMAGDTQCDYVLALAFGLLPEELRPKAAQHLVDNIKEHNMHLTTGFIGTSYLLPVLTLHGHNDIAYKLLLQTSYPSWGYTIRNNATTIWERWDGWTREKGFQDASMNSFNHYAFGSVGRWIFQFMAGIDSDLTDVAFKKIIIKPYVGPGINSTKATFRSMRGDISSSWKIQDNNFTLKVTIPPNTEAKIILPFLKEKWEREVGSGVFEFNVQM